MKKFFSKHSRQARLKVVFGFFVFCLSAVVTAEESVNPSPELTPDTVVSLQLEALQFNDSPYENSGISRAWAFASPDNQAATGPLPDFIQMVRAGYPELLNHREHQLLPLMQWQGQALQRVVLTAADGKRVGFVFALSLHFSRDCGGCWLTDAVVLDPIQPEPLPMA